MLQPTSPLHWSPLKRYTERMRRATRSHTAHVRPLGDGPLVSPLLPPRVAEAEARRRDERTIHRCVILRLKALAQHWAHLNHRTMDVP